MEKNTKFKRVLYILIIVCIMMFLMSDFAYNNFLKYAVVNIASNILTLILLVFALKKIYNKNVNKYITIATFLAISVFVLYIVAFSTGLYEVSIIRTMKEMRILGLIAMLMSGIYGIQYKKVKNLDKKSAE